MDYLDAGFFIETLFLFASGRKLLGLAGADIVEVIRVLRPSKSVLTASEDQVNEISHQDDEAQMVFLQTVKSVIACFHLTSGEQPLLGVGHRFAVFRIHDFFDVLDENLKLKVVFENAGGLDFANVIDNNSHQQGHVVRFFDHAPVTSIDFLTRPDNFLRDCVRPVVEERCLSLANQSSSVRTLLQLLSHVRSST